MMRTVITKDGEHIALVDFLLMHHSITSRERAVLDAMPSFCPLSNFHVRVLDDKIKRTACFKIGDITSARALEIVDGLCYYARINENPGGDFHLPRTTLFTTDYYWRRSGNLIDNTYIFTANLANEGIMACPT